MKRRQRDNYPKEKTTYYQLLLIHQQHWHLHLINLYEHLILQLKCDHLNHQYQLKLEVRDK